MLRTGTAFLGDVDAARDALQDGVADAIRTRRSFRGEGTLEAWLWAIVLNAFRDAYRDRTRTTELETPADHAERAEVATTNGRAAAASVRDAVRRRPQRQRLVLFPPRLRRHGVRRPHHGGPRE